MGNPTLTSRRLDRTLVVTLRKRFAEGVTVAALAAELDLPELRVWRVVTGRSYPDAGGPVALTTVRRSRTRFLTHSLLNWLRAG